MTDLIERLRVAVVTEVNPDDGKTYTTKLGEEAAQEIEKWRSLASDWRRARDEVVSADIHHPRLMAMMTALHDASKEIANYYEKVLK